MQVPKPCVAILASSPVDLRWAPSMSKGCREQLGTHSQPPHFIEKLSKSFLQEPLTVLSLHHSL